MPRFAFRSAPQAILIGMVALFATGCCSGGMKRMNITVSLDKTLEYGGALSTVEVNLVAVNANEEPVWTGKKMGEYWSPNDTFRTKRDPYRHVMRLGPGQQSGTLAKTDPIWDKWEKDIAPTSLVILADLPGVGGTDAGNDPRRLVLTLDKCRWEGEDVKVTVTSSGMRFTPQPAPKK